MAFMFPIVMLVLNASSVAAIWIGGNRIDAGQLEIGAAGRLPELPHPDPDVGDDGHLHGRHGPSGLGERRADPGGARHPDVHRAPPTGPVQDLAAAATLELRDVGLRLPGRRGAGAHRHLLPGRGRARPPPSSAAPGSGKTTLVNLIPRLFDVTAGRVTIDGVDVRDIEPEVLWSRIGLVPQKPYLFSGTVASNLRYGDPDATDDELWEALEVAQAADFVRAMPGGLDAPIAQGGTNVSGGQRQRLAIARALVRKPGDLPLRRLVLGPRPGHRRPPAGRARAPDDRRRGGDRGASGSLDHRTPTRSWCSRTAHQVGLGTHRRAARVLPHLRRDRRLPARRGGGVTDADEDGAAPVPASGRRRRAERDGQGRGPGPRRDRPRADGRRRPGREVQGLPGLDAPPVRARLRHERLRAVGVVVLAVVSVGLTVLGPAHPRRGHRHHRRRRRPADGIDFGRLHRILLGALALYVASSVAGLRADYMLAGVVQRTMRRLRSSVEDKLNRLPARATSTASPAATC